MTFQRISAITLNVGETYLESGVLDTNNNIAYFYTNQNPAKLIKIDISNFSRLDAINLSITNGGCIVIDSSNGFVYIGSQQSPAIVSKVRISDFTEVSTLTLSVNSARSAVIDTVNGFAYFGSFEIPARISKVRLSDFTEVGFLTTSAGITFRPSVIDTINGFAYFGDESDSGTITKIRLSDFTEVATLDSTLPFMHTASIDTSRGFAYFMGDNTSTKVAKINLSTFTVSSVLTLTGLPNNSLSSSEIDPSNNFIYIGTFTDPIRIAQVKISDFTQGTTITFNTGERYTFGGKSVILNLSKGFGYTSSYFGDPSKIIKFGLDGVFANITAIAITAIPRTTSCLEGTCIVDVSVTWQNIGDISGDFVPNISIDTIPVSPAPYTSESVGAGLTTEHTFVVSGLTKAGSPHTICPIPN